MPDHVVTTIVTTMAAQTMQLLFVPVRAQKLNCLVANIAVVGGLIYKIAAGSGRLSLIQ